MNAIYYPTEINGVKIPFDSLYLPYIWKEIYFDSLYVDIVNGKKDMTIIDVGANIGLVTMYLKDYAKRLFAIEPSSEHFKCLERNIIDNGWSNCSAHNIAIADKNGEMTLNTLSSNRTCHSLINDYKQGGEKVKTIKMDTFFEENKIEKCDFMKFDVEGAEDMILRSEGFRKVKDKIDAIEVEFHYPTFPNLVKYMIGLGYTARRYDSSAIVILFLRQ